MDKNDKNSAESKKNTGDVCAEKSGDKPPPAGNESDLTSEVRKVDERDKAELFNEHGRDTRDETNPAQNPMGIAYR